MATAKIPIKIVTYSDESGQDSKGKIFVVCTVILMNNDVEVVEKILNMVEFESKKNRKWSESSPLKKEMYSKLLLEHAIFKIVRVYVSIYENTKEYTVLVASNITKAILAFVDGNDYSSKIFIDRSNKREIEKVKKQIKLFKIKHKKIRGLSDSTNVFVRLADHACGVKRYIKRGKNGEFHKKIDGKLINI